MTCQCLAHGLSCLTVLATGNQVVVKCEVSTEASDDIVPTRLQAELYHSTIHHSLLLDCSALVVLCCVVLCCVCPIVILYNVYTLSIVL